MSPNETTIRLLLGVDAWREIKTKNIKLSAMKDIIIQTTTKSCTILCLHRGDLILFDKFIWSRYLPSRISILLWRLMHNSLPTNAAVRRFNIPSVSKCLCYPLNPKAESTQHLLFASVTTGHILRHKQNHVEFILITTPDPPTCSGGGQIQSVVLFMTS